MVTGRPDVRPAVRVPSGHADEAPQPSAFGRAVLIEQQIAEVGRQIQGLTDLLKQLRGGQRAWAAGGRGEQSVVRVLVGMDDAGWHVLPDRRWPGTSTANIDVLVVGPGGVFVVDVKNWRDVSVEGGRLWRGEADADDELRKLVDQTTAVEAVLVESGLPPTEVVPLLVLAGRRGVRIQLDRVTITGEQDLVRDLVRRGVRLEPELVERVLDHLERGCPPMPGHSIPERRVPERVADHRVPERRRSERAGPEPDVSGRAEQGALLTEDELIEELMAVVDAEPIEAWMTWLHPRQARLINRRTSGPARIRGAAGTGKTVVALHRARYLAARGDRVLFSSLVRTLAPVNRALLTRMAPEHVGRIEFATVHGVAQRCLRELGMGDRFQQAAADTCFWRAWAHVGRHSVLAGLGVVPDYWRDEIATVIKGRGLVAYEHYAELTRVGRGTPLRAAHRRAVWELYECYERLRVERGVLDRDDVLLLARDVVRRRAESGSPGSPGFDGSAGFDAVIVDEVQDLTCVGLQLLHAFVGDKADGLLVVGDGQQAVYPGGFTLAEAGVSVVGRSTVLPRNYRNREAILRYAEDVVAGDSFDDLDSAPEGGPRAVVADRPGGEVHEASLPDPVAQERALCAHVADAHDGRNRRYGDMAVLVPTNAEADRWQRVLTRAGLPAVSLKEYDGTARDAVKVGTYHRAKGLDFAHVYIPDRDRFPRPARPSESAESHRERAALERRQLYVALTRARDSLWVGLREPRPVISVS
jgi:Nuclease-related domain/AAA domain/UvrD-like helicase C-terminal domain